MWGVSAVPAAAGGEAVWMLLDWRPGSSGTTSDAAGKRFAVFEDWLDTTWAEQQAVQAPPVSRTVDGQLALAPGVEALETLDHLRAGGRDGRGQAAADRRDGRLLAHRA